MSDTPAVNIPNETGFEAEVNGPVEVTLYDSFGKAIKVQAADEAHWLARGFSRRAGNPTALLSELTALMDAAKPAITKLVEGVVGDGVINRSDQAQLAAARHAMQLVETTWGDLQTALFALFPLSEGAGVTLAKIERNASGQEIRQEITVDPGQVDLYVGQGWVKPAAPKEE